MTNILSFVIATYLFLLSTAIGIKLTKTLQIDSQRMTYSAAIGVGVLSHVVFLLGIVGLYYRIFAVALIAVVSLFVWKEIVFLFRYVSSARFSMPKSFLNKVVLILIVVISVCSIVLAMAPPYAADTLKYHLAAPKRFIADHRITFIPIMYFNFPQGGEMLYALGMLLFKDTVGILMNAFMGILAAVAVYSFCEKRLGNNVALMSSAIFLSLPLIYHYASSSTPDLGLILYTLLAFFSLFEWI